MTPFLGRRSRENAMEIGEIENRIPFPLLAGQRFRAASNFDLYVPAAILNLLFLS
jgi:hypothetical protein